LGQREGGGDDEDAEALSGAAFVEKAGEEVEGRPDRRAVDDCRGGTDDDADEGGYGEADGDGEKLRPECIAWLPRETSEVGICRTPSTILPSRGFSFQNTIDDQSCKVGYGAHYPFHDAPS